MDYKQFIDLGIDERIIAAAESMGYATATPVQEKAIPLAVSRVDLLVQAPTGTGKTAAFSIPILNAIDTKIKGVQAVVLCPTRELAMQITTEMKKLAANIPDVKIVAVYGGQNIERQFASLRKNPQIVVGTTGRVMDHIRRKTIAMNTIATVVLDEADEMLDMGFKEDIDFILQHTNSARQTLLFSATIPEEITQISAKFQNQPISVKTTCEGQDIPPIKQYVVHVKENTKYEILKELINKENYKNVLVFCNTKIRSAELNDMLNNDNYISVALHGDLRQRERDKVMRVFRDHAANILVATDVAARGIDVEGIEAIINYDIPYDEEFYVHRIGRTARAKADGCAYSFATGRDKANLTACEKIAKTIMLEYSIEGKTEVVKSARKGYAVPTVRFFINVGVKDGATVDNIKEYFVASTSMKAKDVYDVTLQDIYGFIEVDKSFEKEMVGLVGQKCFGRKLAVEVSAARGEKKGRSVERANAPKRGDYSEKRENKPRNKSENGDRQRRTYGDKPKDFSDKPKYESGDKPKRGDGDKPSGEKKPYAKKSYGDKPEGKEYRSFDKKPNDKKPYAKKDGEKRPYQKRNDEAKPYEKRNGESKPYEKRNGDKPNRAYGDKPLGEKSNTKNAYGEKKEYGEKKSYSNRTSKKPYEKQDGEKKSYAKHDGEGYKKTYTKHDGEGYKKPYSTGGAKKTYKTKPAGDRPPKRKSDK